MISRTLSRLLSPASVGNSCVTRGYSKHYELGENGEILGTIKDDDTLYDELKRRLDFTLNGVPITEDFDTILRAVFDPDDIPIITNVKFGLMPIEELYDRVGLPAEEVEKRVDDLGWRGVLIDVVINEQRYVAIPEFAVGWYEYSLRHYAQEGSIENMEKRLQEKGLDIDFKDLMHMYFTYAVMFMNENLLATPTNVLRMAPHGFKDDDDVVECVPYETAQGILEEAESVSITKCVCKFIERSKGDDSVPDDWLDCCLMINQGADIMVKIGHGQYDTKEDAFAVLERFADLGHIHHTTNVKKQPKFLCNCHKNWCNGLLGYHISGEHVSKPSQFLPEFIEGACEGCGVCVERCALDILEFKEGSSKENGFSVSYVVGMEDDCFGCLACHHGCEYGAIKPKRRENVHIPEDIFEVNIRMAFEKDKINALIFNDPDKVSHKVFRALFSFIEANPLSKKMKSLESVESKFIESFAKKARERMYGKK